MQAIFTVSYVNYREREKKSNNNNSNKEKK